MALRRSTLLLACATLAASHPPPDFTGRLLADLEVEAWLNHDRTRGFLRVDGTTSQLYRMWKVRVADLDADGTREIVLGIWSDAPRHAEPRPHRTIWVVAWEDGQFVERWRGSALARPLRDFRIQDEQLVALERTDDHCVETTYAWTGFGFSGTSSARTPCPS